MAAVVAVMMLLTTPLTFLVPQVAALGGLGGPALKVDWTVLASFEGDVSMDAGRQYYIGFDPVTRTFEAIPMPAPDAGLSDTAREAISAVPEWIRPNLTAKLAQVGDVAVSTGPFSSPAVGDLDDDGDADLVIGDDLGVRFYENVGTSEWPVFVNEPGVVLVGDFFGEPAEGGLGRWAPTIGDLDSDGRADLVLGNGAGTLYIYEGTQALWPPEFDGPYPVGTADVGSNSHPELGDMDDDGDLDLTVGCDRGTLSYFENTGGNGSYEFVLRPVRYQGIDVGSDSTPALGDLDGDGDLDLTVGSAASGLVYYSNVAGAFVLDVSVYAGLTVGAGSSPMLTDLYPERLLDLFVGLEEGRVLYLDNIGSSRGPQWKVWSFFDIFEGVAYYPSEAYLKVRTTGAPDRYANLILRAANVYRDEIAFSVANSPPEALRGLNDTQAALFLENVEYLYTIDEQLNYADIVEKEDYTTVSYLTLDDGKLVEREYPRDIYYWYIAHPIVTEEAPRYIDPDTGSSRNPESGGRFWREYLYYNADDTYPSEPPGLYPTSKPPLMSDLLSGITVLWNGTKWHAPPDRDKYYGTNAVIRVSNWVGKTLALNEQESADGERPIQPVRIAHHHNGNCGELQDLTIAAARTALIPARGASMPGEDHVWIEFYEDGWHQWDNYWSDGGSIIDNYMNYWVGWGERGGGGVFAWRGDDATWEVTRDYVDPQDISEVTFVVRDRAGNPVDGARVVVASHWLLQSDTDPVEVTIPFPSIWNYTDYNGTTTLYLAAQEDVRDANKNFSFKVISRIGHAEQGKTELEQGQDYTFEFTLEGVVPRPALDATEAPIEMDTLRLDLEVLPGDGVQLPLNPASDRTQPVYVEAGSAPWSRERPVAFVVDEANLDLFLRGMPFEALRLVENLTETVYLPSDGPSYIVLSTEGQVETSRAVGLKASVEAGLVPPSLTIDAPREGELHPQGEMINITGIASDPFGIDALEVSTNGGSSYRDILIELVDGDYKYQYFTAGEPLGTRNIRVRATNGLGVTAQRQVNITLQELDLDPPVVTIDRPKDGEGFDQGDIIRITGTASDNDRISHLGLSLNDGGSWLDVTSSLAGGLWSYDWDTRGKPSGDYTVRARAVDPTGNEAQDKSSIVLRGEEADRTRPRVTITAPAGGSEHEAGYTIRIEGTATDNVGVDRLVISLGVVEEDIRSSLRQGEWYYDLETDDGDIGSLEISVEAVDDAGNSDEDSLFIYIVEGNGGGGGGGGTPGPTPGPDTTRPRVDIFDPRPAAKLKRGTITMVYGEARDDSGTVYVHILIDGMEENITGLLQAGYFTYALDTGLLSEGDHIIKVVAWDRAGNEDEEEVSFIVVVPDEGDEGGDLIVLTLFPPEVCMVLIVVLVLVLASIALTVRSRGRARELERRMKAMERAKGRGKGKGKTKRTKMKKKRKKVD